LLAHGIDPAALKAALGKHAFAVKMLEWQLARGFNGQATVSERWAAGLRFSDMQLTVPNRRLDEAAVCFSC
jgi:hypothetical protein